MKRGTVLILLMIMLACPAFAGRELNCSVDDCTGLVGHWNFEDLQYDDDFSESTINSNRWSNNGGTLSSGKLVFSTTNAFHSFHSNGKWRIQGDFDIQLDFSDYSRSGSGEILASLEFIISSNDRILLVRHKSSASDRYFATSHVGGSSDTDATGTVSHSSGSFRLIRTGTNVKAYYKSGSSWVLLHQRSGFSTAAGYSSSRSYSSAAGTTCNVKFDNFVVSKGEVAEDTSDSGNNGTIINATWGTGKVGNALSFDGNDDSISISNDAEPIGATSIAFWVKTSSSLNDKFIYGTGMGGSTAGQYIRVMSNKVDWTVDNIATRPFNALSTTSTINDGTWHHILFTWDGTTSINTSKVYFDGVLETQTTATTTRSGTPTYDIQIGRYSDTTGGYFEGQIDELTIWNRSLNATEILTLYNLGVSSISSNTNFTTVYGTTDFSTVSNISSVPNVSLATAKAKIKWANNINAKDQDFDTHVILKERLISINTTALDQTLNTTATLTLENISCVDFERENLLYAPGTFTTLSEVVEVGKTCPHTTCTNVNCTGTTLSFNVEHFTGYAYGGNANLTIDANDPQEIDTIITFTANYTNSSEAHISGASCNITLPDGKGTHDMNESGNIYQYNTTFSTAGFKAYNVTCGKVGYTMLTANDTAEITLLFGEVPELKDYATLILITLLFSAFVFTNKKSLNSY